MSDEITINQEPTESTSMSQNTGVNMDSSLSDTLPEAINAPVDNSTPEVVTNTTPSSMENKAKMAENGQNTENTLENQAHEIKPNPEPTPEPARTPEPRTAQIPGNEPLNSEGEPFSEPVRVETEPAQPKAEATPPPTPPPRTESKPEPAEVIVPIAVVISKNKVLELLNKAKLAIQSRKRKKLDKIMTMFAKQTKISNDEVKKFLHVAERYLNILEKENKIKQNGKTGHSVSYTKI